MENEINSNDGIMLGVEKLFSKPKSAFKIILDKWEPNHKIILLGLYGILNSISTIPFNKINFGLTITVLLFRILFGALIGWVSVWILSVYVNLMNNILGGESELDDVFIVFTFSLIPSIIGILINLVSTVFFKIDSSIFSLFIIIISIIWTYVLVIVGNKLISNLNAVKNIISVLIPFLVMVFISVFFIIVKH